MKYGITAGSLGAMGKVGILKTTEDYFRKAHELGYDCVAIGVNTVPPEKQADFKAFMADLGMCAQMGGQPEADVSYETAKYMGASTLGMALNFRARFTQKWDKARQKEELAKDTEKMIRVEKMARKHDLPVTFENHSDYTTDEILGILAAVNSPYIGINLDTANQLAMAEDPVACARRLAPYVLSTHWKEGILIESPDGAGVIWGVPGEGMCGLPEQARIVQAAGRCKIITLEFLDHFVVPIPYRTSDFWTYLGRTPDQNADGVRFIENAPKLKSDPRPTEPQALAAYELDTRRRSLQAMKAMFGDK